MPVRLHVDIIDHIPNQQQCKIGYAEKKKNSSLGPSISGEDGRGSTITVLDVPLESGNGLMQLDEDGIKTCRVWEWDGPMCGTSFFFFNFHFFFDFLNLLVRGK
jgi:hypothetical protein